MVGLKTDAKLQNIIVLTKNIPKKQLLFTYSSTKKTILLLFYKRNTVFEIINTDVMFIIDIFINVSSM